MCLITNLKRSWSLSGGPCVRGRAGRGRVWVHGCGRAAASVRVSPCLLGVPAYGCVSVCCFLISYLFVSLTWVAAQHDRIVSQTLRVFVDFFCAPVICHGVVLDMFKIPEYVSTRQGKGTSDRCRGRRGSMSFGPLAASIALPSRGMCSRTLVSWSSPSRIVVIVICSVLTHSRDTRLGTLHVQLCSLRAARRGPHTTHALSVCSFFGSWSACENVQNKTMFNRAFCFFCVSFFWGIISMSEGFNSLKK